ncbi:MAG: hypothetical protein ABIO04_08960 [Ferruginibacter sp.]
MKHICTTLFLALLAIPHLVNAQKTYFIAPNGNDKNKGDRFRPFGSWDYINVLVKDGRLTPGDTVFIRGGVYQSNYGDAETNHVLWRNIHGTAEQRICIMAFPGEAPILGLDDINTTQSDPTGLKIEQCSYLHIAGLRVSGLNQIQDGSGLSRGIDISLTSNSIFENLEIDHIGGYGLVLGENTVRSMFVNIDVHHIFDSLTVTGRWNNANGIHCNSASADQDTFRYCRVWKCSNDGFDLTRSTGNFVLEGCWAFWNGYKPYSWDVAGEGSGFKAGQKLHGKMLKRVGKSERVLQSCMAFENRQAGFNQDNGASSFVLFNNISYQNGNGNDGCGFTCEGVRAELLKEFRNNISFKDPQPTRGKTATGMNNSWNVAYNICPNDFISLSSNGADGYRKPNGLLPSLTFLQLKDDSELLKNMTAGEVVSNGSIY